MVSDGLDHKYPVRRVYRGSGTYHTIKTRVPFDVESPSDHVAVHVNRNAPQVETVKHEGDATRRVAFVVLAGIFSWEVLEALVDSTRETAGDAPGGDLGNVSRENRSFMFGKHTHVSMSSTSQSPTRQLS